MTELPKDEPKVGSVFDCDNWKDKETNFDLGGL